MVTAIDIVVSHLVVDGELSQPVEEQQQGGVYIVEPGRQGPRLSGTLHLGLQGQGNVSGPPEQ